MTAAAAARPFVVVTVTEAPPLTELLSPLAMRDDPPLTEESPTLAVLYCPPEIEAKSPEASL